jgi:outer membrane protein assembly factor BamB
MRPNGVLDLNEDGTRRLSRRSWLALVGAAGLATAGGYALVAPERAPGPRWTAPLPAIGGPLTAAADGSALYAHVRDSRGAEAVLALDGETGVQRWRANLDAPLRGVVTMVPAGDALVVAAGDRISVRDAASGGLRWQAGRSNRSQVPGSTQSAAGLGVADEVVVTRSHDGIVALDLRTGELIWSVATTPPENSFGGTADVTAHNGRCFSMYAHLRRTRSGIFAEARIDAWDLRTGRPVWTCELESPSGVGGWVFATGDVVLGGEAGSFVAVDAETGVKGWESFGGNFVTTGDLLVRLQEHRVRALDLADGSVRWSSSEPDEDASHLLGGDGIVYVGESDDDTVIALDTASGATRWTYRGRRQDVPVTVIAAHGRDVYLAAGGQVEAITTA